MPVHHLPVLLRRTAGLLRLTAAGRVAFLSVTAISVTLLAGVFLDALFALPPSGRLAVSAACGVVTLAGLLFFFRESFRRRRNLRATARAIESSLRQTSNPLINAIDLEEHPSATASRRLSERVVREGESMAAEMSSLSAVNFRPLLKGMAIFAATLVVAFVCWFSMPDLFAAVLPRYWEPYEDHPPYTLVRFEVEVSPSPVLAGKPAEILARLGGPVKITQADVVFVEGEGRATRVRQRSPMIQTAEGEFVLALSTASESREFFIETPHGRSRRQMLNVEQIPSWEEAYASWTFPAYTGWKEMRQPLDGRPLRILEGSVVTFRARASLPLRSSALQLEPTEKDARPAVVALLPDPVDAHWVAGEFPAAFSARYRITLTGTHGADAPETVEGRLTVIEDRAPHVHILKPESPLTVVEGYRVPVVVQATDDIGIDRVTLQASINGFGPTPVDLEYDLAGSTAVTATAAFDLRRLGARSGDVVTYSATVWDKRPPTGQFAETELAVIRVIDDREYQELARADYQMEQLVRELDELQKDLDQLQQRQDAIEKEVETLRKRLKDDKKLSDEERRSLEELERQLQKQADALKNEARRLAERANQQPLYDIERDMLEMLRKVSEQIAEQAEAARNAADELQRLMKDPDQEERRRQLAEALENLQQQEGVEDSQEEREQLHNEMNRLQKVDELVQQGERLQKLVEQQRELADRMGEFRNRDKIDEEEQPKAERQSREQERLRQELKETIDELEKTAKECQGECPRTAGDALKLAESIREMKVGEDQSKAAGASREGEGRKAHRAAESAAEKLESLSEKGDDSEKGGAPPDAEGAVGEMSGRDPGMKLSKSGMTESLRQMAAARRLPSLSGPGRKMPGDAPGEERGAPPGNKPGEGTMGSRARSKLMGPHRPMDEGARPRPGDGGRDGMSDTSNDPIAENRPDAENLTPEGRRGTRTSTGNLNGVPAAFRDQAEAYFRRLSEGR